MDGFALSVKTRDPLRNKFAFCLPDREQALGYPVDGGPGSGDAGRRLHAAGAVPASAPSGIGASSYRISAIKH